MKSLTLDFKKNIIVAGIFGGLFTLGNNAIAQENTETKPLEKDAEKVQFQVVNFDLTFEKNEFSTPVMFHMEKSNRIVLDLIGTGAILSETEVLSYNPLISKVISRNVGDRTRVILETKTPVSYEYTKIENKISLILKSSNVFENKTINLVPVETVVKAKDKENKLLEKKAEQNLNAETQKTTVENKVVETEQTTIKLDEKTQLEKLNFKKDKGKVGKLSLVLSKPNVEVKAVKNGSFLIVDLPSVAIAQSFQKKIDSSKLGLITKSIDVSIQGDSAKLILEQASGKEWEFVIAQVDKSVNIEIKELSEYEAFMKSQEGKDAYKGKPLSLNFQNMDVRTILQVIADFSKLNILASDDVKGLMTIRLQNVPWDQALDLVLDSKSLKKVEKGNVLWIATAQEVTKKNQEEKTLREQNAELEPLKLEMLQLNHHKAKEVETLINESKKNGTGMLSARGTIGVDERNNMLFIQDTESKLVEIKKLLKKLDIPIRQVLIESKIVIADDKWGKDLGAKFGFAGKGSIGNKNLFGVAPTMSGSTTSAGAGNNGLSLTPNYASSNINGAGTIGFTILNTLSGLSLGLELQALEANNRGKVLSHPRLLTTDNRKAVLEQGTEIPYVTPGSNGSPATVAFKKAVLSLGVTPQISPNGRIIMNLQIRKDTVGELVSVQGGGQVPSIDTRNIETQVTVNNGQTVVLGGVYEISSRVDAQKVPFLGDVPVLGHLFKQTSKSDDKAELLIFITPYVVEDEVLDVINNGDSIIEEINVERK